MLTDYYTVFSPGKEPTIYAGFTLNPRKYLIPIDSDLGIGPFYTDTPQLAKDEIERYLLEQWGRKCKVAPMLAPIYVHDCDKCKYHGHYFGHDVYTCNGSIIARYGINGDYASSSIVQIQSSLDGKIGIGLNGPSMPMTEFIFSEHCPTYWKAWVIVLMKLAK